MKKTVFFFGLFLIVSIGTIQSQTIDSLGFYSVNGNMSLSSKSGLMVLGNGDIVSVSDPAKPECIGNISLNGFSTSVLVSEEFAYYGSGMSVNLTIADISVNDFPVKIGSLSFPELNGGIFGLAKKTMYYTLPWGRMGYTA